MVSKVDYVDVSSDPAALLRSKISLASIDAVRRLGLSDLGWAMMTIDGKEGLVSFVARSADGLIALSVSHAVGRDTFSAKTLFEDGTIVSTEQRPPGWIGLTTVVAVTALTRRKSLQYDSVASRAPDLASLLAEHRERVARAAVTRGKAVSIDMRTYFATRRRWKEISAPGEASRQRFGLIVALASGIGLTSATFPAAHALSRLASAHLGESAGALTSLLVTLGGLLLVSGASYAAFLAAMALAPYIFRNAAAPPARPARELLALGDYVPLSPIPEPAIPPGAEANAPIPVATSNLESLVRRDLVVILGNVLLYPVTGLALTAVIGQASVVTTVGLFLLLDGVLALLTGKTRTQLLRLAFVPSLVAAEDQAASSCATGGCGLPRRPLAGLWIVLGGAMLFVAKKAIVTHANGAASSSGITSTLVVWAALTLFLAATAWRSARKQHARLVPSR